MSLLRKGIFVSGGQILGVGLNMIVGVLFSRKLGPDGMGQIELFRSTGVLAAVFMTLGLGQANIYFLNSVKVPVTVLATNTFKLSVWLGLVLAVGLAAAILLVPDYFGVVPLASTVLFSLGVGVLVGVALLRPILTARLEALRMVVVDTVNPLTLLVCGVGLALMGFMAPGPGVAVLALGNLSAMGLLLFYLRRDIEVRRSVDWPLMGRVAVHGVKLAASNVLYVFSTSVTVMLLRYLTPDRFDDVGLYTRAVAICGMVTLVPSAIGPLLYAKWSGLQGEERTRQAEMALRLNVAYGVVSALAVFLLGKYIIWLLYGAKFMPGAIALGFLAPATFCIPIFGVCNNMLVSDGRVGITAFIMAGIAATVATVTYLAVPALGIRGAALGALCGNAFTAIGSLVVCFRLYGMSPARCFVLRRSDMAYVVQALRVPLRRGTV
jgi:O-antigen/teichoic acid export membrane protein